ncbi:MAG TPA: hypothetical protein VM387_08785, partial [Gemmatimonadales bacterium]|nr:hypothetical protein [Gemmatimonadales bacterium]
MNGVSVVTAVSVEGLTRAGWTCAVAAPRYPAALHADGAPEIPPGEVHGFASLPMPFYPEVRLARPRGADIGVLMDGFRPDLVH